MDQRPKAIMERHVSFSHLDQLSVKFFGSILSLATGSVCVALVVMYQQKDMAALIVMACSNLLYGLSFFMLSLLYSRRRARMPGLSLGRLGCICLQLVILGAAVYHFDNGRKHSTLPNTLLHRDLLTALDSLLLFTLFVNGMGIASLEFRRKVDEESLENATQLDSDSTIQHGRFVPLKNSSQTLTPSMEMFQNIQNQCGTKLWTMNNPPTTHSSDDISFPSVVKHKLECLSSKEASPVSSISRKASSIKSRLRSGSNSASPKRTRSILSRLRRKKATGAETTNKNINGRYVTRLSTIPDLSKSVLNFILSSSEGPAKQDRVSDSFQDQRIQPSATIPDPALELERDAIERINSALLPPCLRAMETPPPSEHQFAEIPQPAQFNAITKSTHSSPNVLEINDLGEIPQIPASTHDGNSGCSADFDVPAEFPQLMTIESWRENKNKVLEKAQMQHQSLLPAFDLGTQTLPITNGEIHASSFSFPSKACLAKEEGKSSAGRKDSDTISALEEYFRDMDGHEGEEMQIIEDGLKHDLSSSVVAANISKEIIRTSTRHSPTKSMISVISGTSQQRSLTMRNSYLGSDQRPHSQGNIFLPSPTTGILGASAKASPTRSQRLKRIGKKLSLSNISDTVINHSLTSDATGELFGQSRHDHMRGRSIDFSYVHNLQSSHSPTKSVSGQSICGSIFTDRRHSMAADHGIRTASGLFFLQNGNSTINFGQDPTINSTWNEPLSEDRNSSHSASTGISNKSTTNYPDVVMSEYDRERWNTMLNLQLIDSRGQPKAR